MKTWKKYLFIYIPIGIFCCIINFCIKKDNKTPYAKYHLLYEFDKTEYAVNDLYSGKNLGKINYVINNEEIFFDFHAKESYGKFFIGSTENLYRYTKSHLNNIKIEKQKCKNLEFYSGKVGDWYTVVIMSLDNHDYHGYYKSENKRRYLFYLLKNGDYNFSTKDGSVYDVYSAFSASRTGMKYAAILE